MKDNLYRPSLLKVSFHIHFRFYQRRTSVSGKGQISWYAITMWLLSAIYFMVSDIPRVTLLITFVWPFETLLSKDEDNIHRGDKNMTVSSHKFISFPIHYSLRLRKGSRYNQDEKRYIKEGDQIHWLKEKMIKKQTMIRKTLHKKLQNEQHDSN